MFTGISEEIGTVIAVRHGHVASTLCIQAHRILEDIKLGDSICVNGVCLTVTALDQDSFSADVMGETLRRSSLGQLTTKSTVNLERALSLTSRLGGHIVSGHIDGTGKILNIRPESNAHWLTIGTTPQLLRYMVEKGSIAIDGISLTLASVHEASFQVSLIPHTAQNTTLLNHKINDTVNLECDLIGKYIEKLLKPMDSGTAGTTGNSHPNSQLSMTFLAEHGYL